MNARDYYLGVQRAVHGAAFVLSSDLRFEEVDEHVCYIEGVLLLIGDFELYIAEYVLTSPIITRPKYRYHLQTLDGQVISRWDNATHHPKISTFPDHRHDDRDGIHPSLPMDLPSVLDAVLSYILPLQPD